MFYRVSERHVVYTHKPWTLSAHCSFQAAANGLLQAQQIRRQLPMSRRVTDADQVRALQRKHQNLATKLSDLAAQRRVLIQRHAVLSCWCEAFSMLQLNLAVQEPPNQSADAENGKFETLLQNEVQLLGQLVNNAGSCPPTLEALYPDPTPGTIAPLANPMQFLYGFLDRPPLAEAATMTAAELAQFLKQSVNMVSVLLHKFEAAPTEQLSEQLQETWFRYGHLLASFALLGRADISECAHHINLETMVAGEVEATAQQQATHVAQSIPALQLSEQQQELIAVGTHLHYDLLAAVHQERKELYVQMTATLEEGSSLSMSTCVDPACSAGSSAGSGASTDQLQSIQHRRSVLARQQQLAVRLALLLHKEMKQRMIHHAWFIGCLTYVQLSRVAVLSYPYVFRPVLLAAEIMQQWDAHTAAQKGR